MKIEVDPISKSVTLDINGTYTAQELLGVVEQIGKARAEIAKDPTDPVGVQIQSVFSPAYWTEPYPSLGGSLLAFLHPGLGWIGFILPLDAVAALTNFMTNQLLLAAKPAPATGTANPPNSQGGGLLH